MQLLWRLVLSEPRLVLRLCINKSVRLGLGLVDGKLVLVEKLVQPLKCTRAAETEDRGDLLANLDVLCREMAFCSRRMRN